MVVVTYHTEVCTVADSDWFFIPNGATISVYEEGQDRDLPKSPRLLKPKNVHKQKIHLFRDKYILFSKS